MPKVDQLHQQRNYPQIKIYRATHVLPGVKKENGVIPNFQVTETNAAKYIC